MHMKMSLKHAAKAVLLALAVTLPALLPESNLQAQNIVFRMRAANPSEWTRSVPVTINLPKGIDPEKDVSDLGGMELRYNMEEGIYVAAATAELEKGQNQDFAVVIRDVWTVPPDYLERLGLHAQSLTTALTKTAHSEDAVHLKLQIDEMLAQLAERQRRYSIGSVRVVEHIDAFEKTGELLNIVREDIGKLETFAVGMKIDPKELHGIPPSLPESEEKQKFVAERPVVFKMRLENPAGSERLIPLKEYLPSEVLPEDVETDDRLDVRYDDERGACFVEAREGIRVAAGEAVQIDVTMSNRWVISPLRLEELVTRATNVQAVTQGIMDSISKMAAGLAGELAEVGEWKPPEEFNADYVAQFRRQAGRLDSIERSILQMEELLKPKKQQTVFSAKLLERVQAPSRSTTWIIIYIVLGFLGLVSLLFFLRWYGKAGDEQLAAITRENSDETG